MGFWAYDVFTKWCGSTQASASRFVANQLQIGSSDLLGLWLMSEPPSCVVLLLNTDSSQFVFKFFMLNTGSGLHLFCKICTRTYSDLSGSQLMAKPPSAVAQPSLQGFKFASDPPRGVAHHRLWPRHLRQINQQLTPEATKCWRSTQAPTSKFLTNELTNPWTYMALPS